MHHVHLMTGGQRGGGQCERRGEQQRLKQRRRRGGGSAMHKESDAGEKSLTTKNPQNFLIISRRSQHQMILFRLRRQFGTTGSDVSTGL